MNSASSQNHHHNTHHNHNQQQQQQQQQTSQVAAGKSSRSIGNNHSYPLFGSSSIPTSSFAASTSLSPTHRSRDSALDASSASSSTIRHSNGETASLTLNGAMRSMSISTSTAASSSSTSAGGASTSSTTNMASSADDTDDSVSMLPPPKTAGKLRRGAVSAEPFSEEDATSYVKKVISLQLP